MFSYFTINDANKMLPVAVKKFKNILNIKDQIILIQTELETNPRYTSNLKDQVIKKQELNSAMTNFYKSIEELESLGILIKSIEEGLLDFPSTRFNEEVFLCWKNGEKEIKFWHSREEGFMGRKPLSVSDESLV